MNGRQRWFFVGYSREAVVYRLVSAPLPQRAGTPASAGRGNDQCHDPQQPYLRIMTPFLPTRLVSDHVDRYVGIEDTQSSRVGAEHTPASFSGDRDDP